MVDTCVTLPSISKDRGSWEALSYLVDILPSSVGRDKSTSPSSKSLLFDCFIFTYIPALHDIYLYLKELTSCVLIELEQ